MAIRDENEIQAAHDRLTAIALGEVPSPWPHDETEPTMRRALTAALDVLCWVLSHKHNETFAQNLAAIDQWMRERGLILERHDNAHKA